MSMRGGVVRLVCFSAWMATSACGTTTPSSTSTTTGGAGVDAPSGADAGNPAGDAAPVGGDGTTTNDSATTNDATASDAGTTTSDATASDATASDAGPAQDTGTSDSGGGKDGGSGADGDNAVVGCTSDASCGGGFSECLPSMCNLATGQCELKLAADGTACTAKGTCGGSGSCKQGACEVQSACAPVACQAKGLKCGDQVTVPLSDVSTLGAYSCSATVWDGGEAVYTLAADVTQIATVELAGAATASATLIDVAVSGGSCLPNGCGATGQKLVLGVSSKVAHTLVVETVKDTAGPLTLTVTCAAVTSCGDGLCTGTESKASCPKDCGALAPSACGDGQCGDTEACDNCPQDCGSCPPECTPKSSNDPKPAGCGGCACEACVCGKDTFCCKTAWDNLCVGQCVNECKGPKCKAPAACGDNVCQMTESSVSCPNDCPPLAKCGDGNCSGSETCTSCPNDCGLCPGGSKCGDGQCSSSEHCGACPQDCGTCASGTACTAQKAPGCPGCACEACVCEADPYCCENAWDSLCVSQCVNDCDGGPCPVVSCGDGVCSDGESCSSCTKDCGACPPAAAVGCQGHCGSSSKDAAGKTCWCDAACATSKDCCDDKEKFCGK
jgi:hypothetical protein